MNTNIYFIIGGIAIASVIYMIVMHNITKKRKQQAKAFQDNHSNNTLTENQKRLLTFGSILCYHRGEKILGMIPKNGINQYVYGLRQQWEITGAEEAKETLDSLLALERSLEFESFLQEPNAELAKIQKSIAKGLGLDISVVEQTNSAYAWDICRAVSLAKWCYWCGYLSEDEMWHIIQQAVEIANRHGKNWTDYTVSFLLGRTIQGFDLDDLIVESKQILNGKNPTFSKIEDIDVYQRYHFNN